MILQLRLLAGESLRRRQASLRLVVAAHQRPLVTSKQKRALEESQIQGGPTATNPTIRSVGVPPSTTTTTATTTTSSSGGGGGSSSGFVPIGIALGLGVGGASYYYYSTTTTTKAKSLVKKSLDNGDLTSSSSSSHTTPVDNSNTTATSSNFKDDDDDSITEPPAEETSGNRVSQIPASSKMQNAAGSSDTTTIATTTTTAEVDHPVAGHRVTTLLVPQKEDPLPPIDTSMTDAAIAALQSETSVKTAQALIESHSTLATTTIQELEQLQSVVQLKAKILQLSNELQDRTKWEAVRLKEFLVMKEKEVAEK
jgi:hypothetical protein